MTKNELLIIGNGFDLTAGLRSTYQNFFEARYNKELLESVEYYLKNRDQSFEPQLTSIFEKVPNVNFWDIFFIIKYIDTGKKDQTWSNIEEEIKIFLTDYKLGKTLGKTSLKRTLSNYLMGNANDFHSLKQNASVLMILKFTGKMKGLKASNLDDFLSSELIIFESAFADYINNEVNNNMDYETKSILLIDSLVSDITKTSVFSFNYTEVKNENLNSVENVHGKATKNIIFGIDYKNLKYNSEEYKYSKTYRKLLSNVKDISHTGLPKDVGTIKFYGHSLSDADYSYFQSIFDFYSIYDDSNVKIEFFFNVYNEESRPSILANQLSGVTSLLSIYGKTMTNKNHGKNLIHKLILENRIKIIEIDSNGQLMNTL